MGSGATKESRVQAVRQLGAEQMVINCMQLTVTPRVGRSDTTPKMDLTFLDPSFISTIGAAESLAEKCWGVADSLARSAPPVRNAVPARTVRVFVSSTFADMHSEREVLVTKVFPEIRAWCTERHLGFLEIDLRWGVPKETSETETVDICMGELQRCADAAAGKPFFIGLLGERYGWMPQAKDIPENLRNKYEWIPNVSITHMEIFHGMYKRNNSNALILARNSDFVQNIPAGLKNIWSQKHLVARVQLQKLKVTLQSKFPGQYSVYDPTVKRIQDDQVTLGNLDGAQFAEKIAEFLKRRITATYSLSESGDAKAPDANQVQQFFINQSSALFVGRKTELKIFDDILSQKSTSLPSLTRVPGDSSFVEKSYGSENPWQNDGNPLIFISGSRGVGKTKLLARLARNLTETKISDIASFFHFTQADSESGEAINLLRSLTRFGGSKRHNVKMTTFGDHVKEFKSTVLPMLANDPRTVVLVLDGLDKLDTCSSASHLDWLPPRLPGNVFCFVSCDSAHLPTVHRIESRAPQKLLLQPLNHDEQRSFTRQYLQAIGKKLDKDQERLLLAKERSPEWLQLALDELRQFGSFEQLTQRVRELPVGVDELVGQVIQRLKQLEDGSRQPIKCLGLLVCARDGLTEEAMPHLLGELEKQQKVPPQCWSRTLIALGSLVTVNARGVVRLQNEMVKQASIKTLFGKEQNAQHFHRQLAVYFDKLCPDFHAVQHNLPHHLIKSSQGPHAATFLFKDSRARTINPFHKRQFFLDLKCNAMLAGQQSQPATVCTFCLNSTIASRQCLFCGQQGDLDGKLCNKHRQLANASTCMVCGKLVGGNKQLGTNVKLCRWCQGIGAGNCCFVQFAY